MPKTYNIHFKVKIWSYCVYYPPSNISCNTVDLLKMRTITHILPSLTWGIFSHVIRLDQPPEQKHMYVDGLQTRLFSPFFCWWNEFRIKIPNLRQNEIHICF